MGKFIEKEILNMGFKEKMSKKYTETYLNKYGDRLTQVQGKILSVKVEKKCILWIFHKITASLLIKPDRSRNIVKCEFKKKRWFKPVNFIQLSQGHSVIVQGLKGKKDAKKKKQSSEIIEIMNIRNLTTRKDLVPMEGQQPKVQKVRDKRFK